MRSIILGCLQTAAIVAGFVATGALFAHCGRPYVAFRIVDACSNTHDPDACRASREPLDDGAVCGTDTECDEWDAAHPDDRGTAI